MKISFYPLKFSVVINISAEIDVFVEKCEYKCDSPTCIG